MELSRFTRIAPCAWRIERQGPMRVPAILYATEALIRDMDDKVYEQASNVAALPGIEEAAYVMPDAHWGYGFPIGGVAAFDPRQGGVVSAGGVGFDISCGVRLLRTGVTAARVRELQKEVADALFGSVPAGVGSTGAIRLNAGEMISMLTRGARWAVDRGWGSEEDLARIEESGEMAGADPDAVSENAKRRQRDEMGTLGSGNHYLEVQEVAEIFQPAIAATFGLRTGDAVISIHCGSRGLGHQIGTDFLKEMVASARSYRITLPDRELACAPILSELGERYLGAMRAAINCALANRQIVTHLARKAFREVLPEAKLSLLYDVSHNTCKVETHPIGHTMKKLWVHRKGATRAFGPGHPEVPAEFQSTGQPVLIGGTMGTSSYVLAGRSESESLSFSSACHGAGRAMSRSQALKRWHGRAVMDDLAKEGILIRSPSPRGVAEEAPGAYKDVSAVVDAAEEAGLARKVARLRPIVCVKG
ncbi:MAG TPA: RtcB family protein [Candidatus Eisenbacteria bacterium]|nr:RtcB family protein [Candidatus Eisenbacteria bacterium]